MSLLGSIVVEDLNECW